MNIFRNIAVVLLINFVLVINTKSVAVAETDLTSPGTLNNAGENYKLIDDISASGTAFTINANNITLDLNGHTIIYNTASSQSAVNGISISASGVTVKNGTVIQGNGKSSHSPVIQISNGSGNKLHHLVLKPTGVKCYGISGIRSVEIHHVYIESHTTTSCDRGDGIAAMQLEGGDGVGDIHDNIFVNGHTGLVLIGGSQETKVYNNRIQHERRPGCKAPYGIGLSYRIHNVEVYNNQIISDNGRGIILDGWSQGAPEGASGNHIHNNRIDVQYSKAASSGYYVENAVYGIRDRYSSGNNIFEDNVVIAANGIDGRLRAFYIGSDGSDLKMINLLLQNNIIISRGMDSDIPFGAFVFYFDYAQGITAINNKYFTDGSFLRQEHHVSNLTLSGNSALSPDSYTPKSPTGLKIIKFLESYMLVWNDNRNLSGESQTHEYIVYRDGQRLPISPRGGMFYVDVDIGGTHTYSVSALNLNGNEGPQSQDISTNSSVNGWWDDTGSPSLDSVPPDPPISLDVN